MKQTAVIVSLLLALVLPAQAQLLEGTRPPTGSGGGMFGAQGGTYYNFSSNTGCDLRISVWGFVGGPGQYMVPCDTDLLAFLSYCGGPRKGAYLDRVRIVRRGNADQQNEIREVFEVNVEKYLGLTSIPAMTTELNLFPGDLIIIDGMEESYVDTFLRVAQVVVAVSSLVTTTVAVINLTKN